MRRAAMRVIRALAKDLRVQMEKEHGPDLAGHCGEASFRLTRQLEVIGFRVTPHIGWVAFNHGRGYHCWIEVVDYLIDITGDQFNGDLQSPLPKIMIRLESKCSLYKSETNADWHLWQMYGKEYHNSRPSRKTLRELGYSLKKSLAKDLLA